MYNDERARNSLETFFTTRYDANWAILKLWFSNHGEFCECDYETPCHFKQRGYWNAWAVTRGNRTRWFYSPRTHKWYRGRLRLARSAA